MMNPTHTAMTKHLRKRLRHEGIAARCDAYVSCGVQFVRVFPTSYEASFTEDEQRKILIMVQVNGLTLSRGMAIDINQMTYAKGGHFVLPA